MAKLKTETFLLPSPLKSTLITISFIAFVVTVIFWIALMLRVYPEGVRFSQFSVLAITEMTVPVILFLSSYYWIAKNQYSLRVDKLFTATTLTFLGLAISTALSVLDRQLSLRDTPYSSASLGGWMPLLPSIAMLILFTIILAFIRYRIVSPYLSRLIQKIFIATIIATFVVVSLITIYELVSRQIGTSNVFALLFHEQFLITVILPVTFFSIAYSVLSKNSGRLSKLFTSLVYVTIGVVISIIVGNVLSVIAWSLPIGVMSSWDVMRTAIVFLVSILAFTILIISYNTSTEKNKKTRKNSPKRP